MSLLNVVRSAVAVANKVTKPLQPKVTYRRFTSGDGEGTKAHGSAVLLDAIVDWTQKSLRTSSGELTVSRASVSLLDIKQVVAATNGEGIGDNDIFILPDGTTGPILDMKGFIDAGTGHPIATEVFLG